VHREIEGDERGRADVILRELAARQVDTPHLVSRGSEERRR
jgi:hypothetical protein